MADYAQYHALGHGEHIDPNDPSRTTAPAPPQFQHPVAQSPYQQQQQQGMGGPAYGTAPQYHGGPQAPMGGLPPPPPGQMYGMPQDQGFQGGQLPPSRDGTLASQMAGMDLGAADGQGTVRRKKKDRHAHHTVETAGSSQAFNGMPPPGTPSTQFLNNMAGQPSPGFGGQFGTPQGTPQMFSQGQFSPGPGAAAFPSSGPVSPAGFPQGNGSADASATISTAGPTRVSADDLPSVPASRDVVQDYFLKNIYPTFERHVPPPATVSFVAYDQGNSSPKYTRLTMNNIPATADGLHATGLPLGLLLQPLAPLQTGEAEIPVLDFGEAGPPRCRRCRAYINPFMMFRSGGSKFVCNLCTHPNDTAAEYFCATSPQGVRVDRDQRPELHRGTVEFVVPKEYWTKEPTGLRWLFLIDATQESYNKGFMETFCDGILAALYGGEDEETNEDGEPKRRLPEGSKVGFVTYDKDIHFYNLHVSTISWHTLSDK